MDKKEHSIFFSSDIKISIMINSLYFKYYQIFIVEKDTEYLLYGEKYPSIFFLLGRYKTINDAQMAVKEIIQPYDCMKDEKPEWGPKYKPEFLWVEKFHKYIKAEHLQLRIRIYLIKKIGNIALLIADDEDLRERHFFMPQDEEIIQDIMHDFGFLIDIKKISPLSINNILGSIEINEQKSNL